MEQLQGRRMPERQEIDIAGVKTAYYAAGEGPETIVLIYGGNFGTADSASSALVWDLNFSELAKHHKVIAFDKLGQGYTGPPLRDEDYTMSAVVRHAIGLTSALNLESFHLVGHSRGGFAAARMALEIQHKVNSLTICSSGTLSSGVGANEVVLAMPPFPSGSRDAARWIYQNYSSKPEVVDEQWIDGVMDVLATEAYQAGVKKYSGESLGVSLFVPELAKLKRETLTWIRDGRLQRPVQMIWGANDKTVPIERGLELFDLIAAHERRATFNVINDAGHFTFREHPEQFNELISSFVQLYKG